MVQKSHSSRDTDDDFQNDMKIMRHVMDKNWVVLRALALGDENPELNAEELVTMAELQRSKR